MYNNSRCWGSGEKGVQIMNNVRVLSVEEEYKFLKKVCPDYDFFVKGPAPRALLELDRSDWKHMRNLVGVLLMLDVGLRVGEAVRIRYTDVYFNLLPVNVITVRAEIAKGNLERTVPVCNRLRRVLECFLPDPLLLADYPNTQKVISRSKQGPGLTTRAVEKMTKWAGIRAFGEPVNPHMLRHTFATKLMRITDMRTVQAMLGHVNLNSTQIYTHPDTNDMKIAIDKLNNIGEDIKTSGSDIPG